MPDITLRDRDVLVEGQLVVEGSDIHLTIESRKSSDNTKPYRRALVHGFQDDLVVNYDNDYTGVVINGAGGIALNGTTTIKGVDVVAELKRLLGAINVLERLAGAASTPTVPLTIKDATTNFRLNPEINSNLHPVTKKRIPIVPKESRKPGRK